MSVMSKKGKGVGWSRKRGPRTWGRDLVVTDTLLPQKANHTYTTTTDDDGGGRQQQHPPKERGIDTQPPPNHSTTYSSSTPLPGTLGRPQITPTLHTRKG